MERRGWIVALGAVALIGIGLYIWWSDSSAQSQGRSGSDQDENHVNGVNGASHEGGGEGVASTGSEGRQIARDDRHHGDGGVDRVAMSTQGSPRPTGPNGLPLDRGMRRDEAANRSAGWRLGQARARIEILEGLVERYRTAYDGFVAAGNTDSATRQRATLDRVTGRLEAMRELETGLLEEAQADGTMGDVETGLEEGEPTRVRLGAPGRVRTR